jgi:Short C-terminal domain
MLEPYEGWARQGSHSLCDADSGLPHIASMPGPVRQCRLTATATGPFATKAALWVLASSTHGFHPMKGDDMPRMLRRAAVLGATAHVAAQRGAAKGAETAQAQAAQEQAAQDQAAPQEAPSAPIDPPPPVDAAVAAAPVDYAQLTKLKELLDDGILTQEEFDGEKAKVLAG